MKTISTTENWWKVKSFLYKCPGELWNELSQNDSRDVCNARCAHNRHEFIWKKRKFSEQSILLVNSTKGRFFVDYKIFGEYNWFIYGTLIFGTYVYSLYFHSMKVKWTKSELQDYKIRH